MATTLDSIVVRPTKAHHRGVAMMIAGLLLVGGAAATTAAVVAEDGHSSPAPVHVTTPAASPAQDTLVTRYGQESASQPFSAQPKLRLGGAR